MALKERIKSRTPPPVPPAWKPTPVGSKKSFNLKYIVGALIVAGVTYMALRKTPAANDVEVTATPTVSIIMIAHNENMYLERTFDSIMNNTPLEHLVEIIFVDDASDPPASTVLDKMGNKRIKIIRNEERTGLIRAKTAGARAAQGDVLVFLDAHIRAYPGWLEPMIQLTSQNYRRVVVPVIPVLNAKTWEQINNYEGVKLIFDWKMDFIWYVDEAPANKLHDYVPIMSGGLLAITRKWFFETGAYDEGMLQWGGENVEQSVKIWLCGGEIIVARNSRVGHVFREESPYQLNITQIHVNKARAIDVWFDEWANYYYRANPFDRERRSSAESLASRFKIKEDLNCKPFSTFVDRFSDIMAEKHLLSTEVFGLRSTKTGLCIKLFPDGTLKGIACDAADRGQVFIPDGWGRLRSGKFTDDCWAQQTPLGVSLCSAHEAPQKNWVVDEAEGLVKRFDGNFDIHQDDDNNKDRGNRFCLHMKDDGVLSMDQNCIEGEFEKFNVAPYDHSLYK